MTIESVTLVGPSLEDKFVGIRRYHDSLSAALRGKGVRVNEHSWWKKDWWIGGRNVGAVATPLISRLRSPPPADITHAIFSNYASHDCQVITVMDLAWKQPGYPEARILNNIYKRAMSKRVIICPTDVIAVQVAQWLKIDPSKIFTTHLAPAPEFKVKNLEKYPMTTVLFVGDANERKRTLESVKALEGLDVEAVHVGHRWATTKYGILCLEEAHKRGVVVRDLGPLSTEGLAHVYNRSHVLLYPSSEEGFGLPPLEAAKCGLQSVVGRHPVFAEVLGDTSVPCDGARPESIRDAVECALAYPIKANDLTTRASRFSWEKCADETLKAYEASL